MIIKYFLWICFYKEVIFYIKNANRNNFSAGKLSDFVNEKIIGMKQFSFLFSITLLLILSCKKDIPVTLPDDVPTQGMYIISQFAENQLRKYTDVQYSVRSNYKYLQYTSGKTQAEEQTQDNLYLKMDITVPPNATAQKRQPLIVFVHGGGFYMGDKGGQSAMIQSYALAGYVIASINYRLTSNNTSSPTLRLKAVMDAQEDAQNAIRYLKKNLDKYYIDTTRVCIMGSSAGGGTALIAAVEADNALFISDYPKISARTQAAVSTGATLVNEDTQGNPGLLHFDSKDAPVLMFHAKETDSSTGCTWTGCAVPTQKLFSDVGVYCSLIAQPDMTHTIDLSVGGDYWAHIKAFLWDKLKLKNM